MPDSKVSGLPAKNPVVDTDEIPLSDGTTVSKKAALSVLKTYFLSTGTKVSGLGAAVSVLNAFEFPVNNGGVSKKVAASVLKTFVRTDTVVALTDAASITTDVALGDYFTILFTFGVGATRALANPTGMVDRQEAIWEFTQDSNGSRALTLGTAFAVPTGATFALSTAPNAKDFMIARYIAATAKWYVLGFIKF